MFFVVCLGQARVGGSVCLFLNEQSLTSMILEEWLVLTPFAYQATLALEQQSICLVPTLLSWPGFLEG